MLGGVAAALADEVGVDAFVLRVGFVTLAIAGGWGVVLYAVLWVAMRAVGVAPDPGRSEPKGSSETNRLVGLGMILLGLLLFFRLLGAGFVDSMVWPVALFGAGLAVAHEQGVDLARAGRLAGDSDRSAFLVRVAGGAVLVVAGIILAVSLNFSLSTARDTMLVAGVVIAGVGLVLGPWVVGLVNDLTDERRARIRSDERAQVAAHLHDSVLQTLTLIQRRAGDSSVVSLARKQERELRSWLYGREPAAGSLSFRAGLEHELGEIEDLHHVPIELVVVGDTEVDDDLRAVLAATREAAVNAVMHSGSAGVDVFAEVTADAVEVFIRDTGKGFDPENVPADRRGLADSIVGRIERMGGTVVIDSQPGRGAEVELHLDRKMR
jgi:signal transduction histidine kinase